MSLFDRIGLRIADPARMRVYPVMLAVIPLSVWGASVAMGSGNMDGAGRFIGPDFVAFYTGGVFASQGRVVDLGSTVAQHDFQQALAAPRALPGFARWMSPPFVAYAFAPLAVRSYPVALLGFWALGIAALVATAIVLRRLLDLRASVPRLLVLAVSYFPTVAWFAFGQTTAFSLSLMVLSIAGLLARRDFVAGLALGCFAYKPQLALGVGLALLFARRWRALAGTVASGLALLTASFVVEPVATEAWLSGSVGLAAFVRQDGYATWGSASLFGASTLLFDGLSHRLASLVGASCVLAAIVGLHALWTRVPWRPEHPSFRLALASTLAATLLVSPHLYFYDLMILLLPAALAFSALARSSDHEREPIVAATAWVYTLALPSPYLAQAQEMVTRRLTGHPGALQVETVAVGIWAWRVGRCALTAA